MATIIASSFLAFPFIRKLSSAHSGAALMTKARACKRERGASVEAKAEAARKVAKLRMQALPPLRFAQCSGGE